MNKETVGPPSEYSAYGISPPPPKKFSRRKPIIIVLVLIVAFAALIVIALGPRLRKDREVQESLERTQQAPVVLVAMARRNADSSELVLPGSVQALTESPIFARSEGFLRKRLVDMGDRVTSGQLLATVEAPEVDKQVEQGQATLARAEAAHRQAAAALQQSNTQLALAKVTAERWRTLFTRKVVSQQEADEKQAAYEARMADNDAARANVAAAEETTAASRADLQRLREMKGFQEIRAPFAGVITARNTEVGALIRSGGSEGRELFRLAGIDTVRVMANVPQTNVPAIRVGLATVVTVTERPDVQFQGTIVRTANALDPATRTLLTEIHVQNSKHLLLPGMYAQVRLPQSENASNLVVRGDTVIVRADGPQVAVVTDQGMVHFQKIKLGRDYGANIEVIQGLKGGERLVISPGDEIQEGVIVKARPAEKRASSER